KFQQVFGAGPALVHLADEILFRHLHVIEKDLVDFLRTLDGEIERRDRIDADAVGFHIDQQERNALLRLATRRGAYEAENPVRILGKGGPDLRSVAEEMIALVL